MQNDIIDYQLKTDRTAVYISSKDRTSGGTSNFTMNMMPWIDNARLWRMRSISVPFSWYVFRSGNNVFSVDTALGGTTSVTIAPGNYTTSALKTHLEALLNGATVGVWTVTFNAITGKMTVSVVGGGGQQVGMNTPSLVAGTANEALGFTQQVALGASITGNNVYNLSGELDLYVRSQSLRDRESLESQSGQEYELSYTDIIFRVPVDVNSGSIIVNKKPSRWMDYPNNKITKLDFRLTFKDGEIVNLNGLEYSMELEFIGSF